MDGNIPVRTAAKRLVFGAAAAAPRNSRDIGRLVAFAGGYSRDALRLKSGERVIRAVGQGNDSKF
jgi:hypothetical protein